ncbi:uncharacterized protein IL334_002576 [Kwoniella shivajii]|uniref:DUF1783-domain-containing protein n=1 Tax=Kwoniella shivajii TaxID=564305 RepID=A0ABZ1CY67_9TREE|nr:hypothetical protein IL334_002576 [Kwoniella shivajii]
MTMRSLSLFTSLRSLPRSTYILGRSSSLSTPIRWNTSNASHTSRVQAEATTFASKSAPRTIYDSPEASRGMPPPSSGFQRRRVEEPKIQREGEKGEAFNGPSRPRLIYERPGDRDLPRITNKLPYVLALGLLGLGWGLFLLHATNAERLASSVLRQVTFQLRNSKEVIAVLGEHVRLVENWWALGQPWISGTINLMQGRVDLSFRIRGDKGAGTVYFTSIRPQEQGAWRIVRYKIIADDGEVVRLENLENFKTKL